MKETHKEYSAQVSRKIDIQCVEKGIRKSEWSNAGNFIGAPEMQYARAYDNIEDARKAIKNAEALGLKGNVSRVGYITVSCDQNDSQVVVKSRIRVREVTEWETIEE